MKVDKEIMDSIEEAKKHQDFRLRKCSWYLPVKSALKWKRSA